MNQFYCSQPQTNIWPDIGLRLSTVKLVHQFSQSIINRVPPAGGTAAPAQCLCTCAVGCQLVCLWLMGALSLTHSKPRERSGLHATPGLASKVLTMSLCTCMGPCLYGPGGGHLALHAQFPSVPTSGVRSLVIYPFPTCANSEPISGPVS